MENLVKAWKTTILGSLIILAGLVLIGLDKLDGLGFVAVAGVGVALLGTDALKEIKKKANVK